MYFNEESTGFSNELNVGSGKRRGSRMMAIVLAEHLEWRSLGWEQIRGVVETKKLGLGMVSLRHLLDIQVERLHGSWIYGSGG